MNYTEICEEAKKLTIRDSMNLVEFLHSQIIEKSKKVDLNNDDALDNILDHGGEQN